MHLDLLCYNVLSIRDHVGADFYALNEPKKKLKNRLGTWGRPAKKVTFISRPEG